jgi:hypothetical protein
MVHSFLGSVDPLEQSTPLSSMSRVGLCNTQDQVQAPRFAMFSAWGWETESARQHIHSLPVHNHHPLLNQMQVVQGDEAGYHLRRVPLVPIPAAHLRLLPFHLLHPLHPSASASAALPPAPSCPSIALPLQQNHRQHAQNPEPVNGDR